MVFHGPSTDERTFADLTLGRNMRFDLHMHSTLSDGRHPPIEVLRRCAAGGLDVVALTDHDFGTSVRPGPWQFGERSVYVIGGAELTGVLDGREYHLLVYFPGPIPQGFRDFCRRQCQVRARRYDAAVDALAVDLPHADATALAGDRALTSHHLARALVKHGHAGSKREAFDRHIQPARRALPSAFGPLTEAISVARSFGGLTSWAHPSVRDVQRYIAPLAEAGLQGIEAFRPRVPRTDRRALRGLARRHGLFLTGGSDWHGWTDPPLGGYGLEAQQISGFIDALATT